MKLKLVLTIMALVFITATCKTAVEPEAEPEPGRRDYVWTVDTIKVYGGSNMGVYAVDSNNIWLAFAAGYYQKLFHYNGKKWEPVFLSGNYQASRITGNSASDIWILPEFGDSYRFDGSKWNNIKINNTTKYKRVVFYQLAWGENGDIYAAGAGSNQDFSEPKCVIAKFVNNDWKFVELPEIAGAFVNITYDRPTKKYYLLCWPEGKSILYQFDGKKIEFFDEGYGLGVHQIGKNTFFQKEGYIYQLKNGVMVKFFEEKIRGNETLLFGNSKNDMFFVKNQMFSHYNGTDTKELFEIPLHQNFNDGKVNKNVAVMVTYYNYENYIYIGKLK